MGGDKMSHSPYLDSCNMIEKSFFSELVYFFIAKF